MLHMIGHDIFGRIIDLVARAVMPGRQHPAHGPDICKRMLFYQNEVGRWLDWTATPKGDT